MSVYWCVLCFIVYSMWRFGILMIFCGLSSKFFASRRSKGSIKVTSHPVTRSRRVRPEGSPKGPRRVPEGSKGLGGLTLAQSPCKAQRLRSTPDRPGLTRQVRRVEPGGQCKAEISWANDRNHEISITFIIFHQFSSSIFVLQCPMSSCFDQCKLTQVRS